MNKALIAMALCAGLAAAPAAAQKFSPTKDTAETMASYNKLLTYGDCVLGEGETGAAQGVLTTKPYSKSERSKTGLLRQRVKTCPAKGFENLHSLVRGAFAEGMYHRQFKVAPAAADATRVATFVAAEKVFHSERDQGDQLMASVMSCMVAASPQSAHALLATTHGSAAEDSAMNAFFAAGSKCGAGSTRPANLSRSFVRAFVADSAWRFGHTVTR
jgi:hypothetical protein